MTGVGWVDGLIVAAAAVTAIWTIWRRAIRPFYKLVTIAAEAVPVLIEIAEEFRPNAGHSLRDVIDTISKDLSSVQVDMAAVRVSQVTKETNEEG